MDVPWPAQFESFTANLKVMFFDFVQVAGLLCEVKVDFYTSLYVSTMTIVAVLALIFVFYRSRIRQEPFKSLKAKKERLWSKCVKASFYFLVLLKLNEDRHFFVVDMSLPPKSDIIAILGVFDYVFFY